MSLSSNPQSSFDYLVNTIRPAISIMVPHGAQQQYSYDLVNAIELVLSKRIALQ